MTEPSPSDQSAIAPTPPKGGASGQSPRPNTAMSGFLGGLIGGIAAAALVAGAVVASWPMLRAELVPTNDPKTAAVEDLNRRVAALESAAGRPPSKDADVAQLKLRVGVLEQAPHPAADDPRFAALVDKTNQLTDQIAKLSGVGGDTAEMQRLVGKAEAAAQGAHDAVAKHQSAEALLIVAGQLRDAAERGGPYSVELAAARKVAPTSAGPALDLLATSADTGVTGRSQLAEGFPNVAANIARVSLIPPQSDGLLDRLVREAATLVSVRRVNGEGGDPASVAARAEKAVRAGDLAGAVKELGALEGAPAEAAKTWLAAARARLVVEQGLSALAAVSAATLGASDG